MVAPCKCHHVGKVQKPRLHCLTPVQDSIVTKWVFKKLMGLFHSLFPTHWLTAKGSEINEVVKQPGGSAQVPPASWPRCQHLLGYCGQVALPSLHVALPAPGDLSLLRTVAHASLSSCPPSARDHPPSCSGVGASPAHPCSPPAGHVLSPLLSFAVSQPGCHPLLLAVILSSQFPSPA